MFDNNTNRGNAPSGLLGSLSAWHESGGRGPGTVSSGKGDAGGVSYGIYQLSSRRGRPEQFLMREGAPWREEFGSARSGTAAFSRIWTAIAAREPETFGMAQHDFVKRTHYDVQIAHILAKTGLNLDRRGKAVRDAVWSTAVQHGPASNIVVRALAGGNPEDHSLLKAIYAERGRRGADGRLVHFAANSAAVQAGVARRFRVELRDALAMLETIKV